MAPKKGGGKKAKEKALQEERERLAEEARLAELAEQEKREKERIEQERLEQLRREEEARLQAELDERIEYEDAENAAEYEANAAALVKQRDQAIDLEEWVRYTDCSALPEVGSEAEVNGFLSEWEEEFSKELAGTVADCEIGHLLAAELLAESVTAAERGDANKAAWQLDLRAKADECIMSKLNVASADFLQRADEYANAKNEVLFCSKQERCKLGLWVNLAKNPRVKSIDYAELNISTELPKALALASVAIRAMQFNADRLTPLEPPPAAANGTTYMTLGGVLLLELLSLPPTSKKVKGWTMRPITELSKNVHKQQYPVPPTGADAAAAISASSAPSLRITYELPPTVVVPEDGWTVGWFDEAEGVWKTDGISEWTFDRETRVVSFLSVRLSTGLAVIEPTHAEMPYKRWLYTNDGVAEGTMFLETKRRTYEFSVSPAGAALRSPRLPELEAAGVLDVFMPPPKLLLLLRTCGINLTPADTDAAQLSRVSIKEVELERELYTAIVPLVSHLQIASSKWNASRTSDKCVFRLAPKKQVVPGLDDLAEGAACADPFKDVDDSWAILCFQHRNVGLIKASEADAVCDMAVITEAHSTPVLCLRGQYPDVGQDGGVKTTRIYQDNVRQLFQMLRVISFTS